jgi:flavorubredoxin
MQPKAPKNHHEPLKIAEDTFLIQQIQQMDGAPIGVYVNSLVIRGPEPIVVDTGTRANRSAWIKDVLSLVDPKDVKYLFLSHDDVDHTGNLELAIQMFSNATIIGNGFMVERMLSDFEFPLPRMRWISDGESFEAGGRTFYAIRPPVFDSPVTRGLYDPKTGLYWGSDAFGCPIEKPVESVGDLDPEFYENGFNEITSINSPWVHLTDYDKFNKRVDKVAGLDLRVIASAHGPTAFGKQQVNRAIEIMRNSPNIEQHYFPGQELLDQIVAAMMDEQQLAA